MTLIYIVTGIAILPLIIWGFYAQIKVRQVFAKYSKIPVKKGITGSRLARTMLNDEGLSKVIVEEGGDSLSDHYDPRRKVIRLSRGVARHASVTAIGVAAHEAAHAVQDARGHELTRLRNVIAPVIEKASYLVLPLFLFGILIGGVLASAFFVNIAVFIFFGIAVFYLVTLPVELNASSYAVRYIRENGITDEKELEGVREVLKAAAMTYIIAAAIAITQFLRLFTMASARCRITACRESDVKV
jgi:uncharacterized protein